MSNKQNTTYRQNTAVPIAILVVSKLLQAISPELAALYAARLFMTPVRYKTPKRELHMDQGSQQSRITVPALGKEVVVYEYGKSDKKVLLVHGWCGRGTQLVRIADALLDAGYATVSFDAPAHGKSGGKRSNMGEFIEAVMFLEQHYGPFEYAVGHSLGGMTILNAVKNGVHLKKAVLIGSGDVVKDIAADFISKIGMKEATGERMISIFNKRFNRDINQLSASIAALNVTIPVLIFHDTNDTDVPLSSAKNIHKNLVSSELVVTEGLGHRKILGDDYVIHRIVSFLSN